MTGPLVIFHADCFDGFTAAWVCQKFIPDAEYFAARYGAPRPPDEQLKGRRVYVVDFSYPRDVMKQIILVSRSTVVLDHHRTAQAALSGILDELQDIGQRQPGDEIVFDMERSGAGIAWDYLSQRSHGGWTSGHCPECGAGDSEATPVSTFRHQGGCWLGRPWLVNYVEDRDLWRQSLPNVKEVSAWVATQAMTFEAWDAMAMAGFNAAVVGGRNVQAYIDQYGRKARAESRHERIRNPRALDPINEGWFVPVVNLPYMNCSEHVGELLKENRDALFAAGYFQRRDGRWQFSLRSRPDFDVSEVAKLFGGGGHAGAAGFDVDKLPW